jgi:predicted NAD-dependent protein-ADP-ribosyltransferase YbiA (DUF1768 family)
MAGKDDVRSYRASEKPYGAFSNLCGRQIELEGEAFATSEHAYVGHPGGAAAGQAACASLRRSFQISCAKD